MKILLVEWLDSVSLAGWHPAADALDELTADDALHHTTVGHLVADLPDLIVLAASRGLAPRSELGDVIGIPRPAILNVTDLTPKSAGK